MYRLICYIDPTGSGKTLSFDWASDFKERKFIFSQKGYKEDDFKILDVGFVSSKKMARQFEEKCRKKYERQIQAGS